ncbi:CLUMA_CG021180, isoform A [Clunio marinus]|uniref:CLUMA_CG021180, isoform A n=1 Tax=Clunio marinus TaxID=568069 RepID=A0A1J1J8D3_9DIPT|nr:CLUMA_CG021180, isoform A [Clunio marinus]
MSITTDKQISLGRNITLSPQIQRIALCDEVSNEINGYGICQKIIIVKACFRARKQIQAKRFIYRLKEMQ